MILEQLSICWPSVITDLQISPFCFKRHLKIISEKNKYKPSVFLSIPISSLLAYVSQTLTWAIIQFIALFAKPVTSAFMLKYQMHRSEALLITLIRVRNATESSSLRTYSEKEKVQKVQIPSGYLIIQNQKVLRVQYCCIASVLFCIYIQRNTSVTWISQHLFMRFFLNKRKEEKLKAGNTPIIATIPQPATK